MEQNNNKKNVEELSSKHALVPSVKTSILGALINSIFIQPLWGMKTRLQTKQPFTLNPAVLYRGYTSTVVGLMPIVTTRITARNQVLHEYYQTDNPTFSQSAVSAVAGGVSSSFITSPLELVLTQKHKEKQGQKPKSSFAIYSELVKNGRGLVGAPLVAARESMLILTFATFTPEFKLYLQRNGYVKNDFAATVASGTIIAIFAALFSQPLDTVKTAQQANATVKDRQSISAFQVAKQIMKKEGVKGLNAGLFWRTLMMVTTVDCLAYTMDESSSLSNHGH